MARHLFLPYVPDKAKPFSAVIPGDVSTYANRRPNDAPVEEIREMESQYYREMHDVARVSFCVAAAAVCQTFSALIFASNCRHDILQLGVGLFCLTFAKSGWDCMRHLEILANGCVPLFTGDGAAVDLAFLPSEM